MHVAHIIFRFDYGGLENGVVNVINGLNDDDQRHTVIALTEATEFAGRPTTVIDIVANWARVPLTPRPTTKRKR